MTDVCLILEGTYPFKTGGVTTWIRALVNGLPDIAFSVAHIYHGEMPTLPKVPVPQNLKTIALIPLNEMESAVSMSDLVDLLPEARLYHSLSTGFAGLLGTEMKRRSGLPFVLTEHGIYWHEVSLGADELECGFKIVNTENGELQLGRTWETWRQTFEDFARQAYASADVITTVCSFNQSLQRSLGAPEARMQVISNGVDVSRNGAHASVGKKSDGKIRIALVGRVTPIKDVKTFIRAAAVVKERIPRTEFLVIGPLDHDARYTAECMELAERLHLDTLEFTGEADMANHYSAIDITVLTSISEAQPYAVLESFAHGIPVVVTDVGGCPELVNGHGTSKSRAGTLCPVGDHMRIAEAIIELSTNTSLYQEYALEGLRRAKELYAEKPVIASYSRIYERLLKE
ncbi:MAG: GT4 family glycosyltransferase PelF [Ignavibacteriales bacterium]|nr:GT4 family glycosyltransferase PelF [Ignavibacteriales bacterium]